MSLYNTMTQKNFCGLVVRRRLVQILPHLPCGNLAYSLVFSALITVSAANAAPVHSAAERTVPTTRINMAVDSTLPLEERLLRAKDELYKGDLPGFKLTTQAIYDTFGSAGLSELSPAMYAIATYNDTDLLAWFFEHCPDCAASKTGNSIIHSMGSNFQGRPWRGINFDTFEYLYSEGAVNSFGRQSPDTSVVEKIADYWIPEGDGVYGDYVTTTADRDNEAARRADKLNILRLLFENGHDINSTSYKEQKTALVRATLANDQQLFDFLLDNGADPKIGQSPLSAVTVHTSPYILNRLLESGLDPNTVTGSAYSSPSAGTVLGRIVESGRFTPELLEVLDAHNIDVTVIDGKGKTAIDYATSEYGETEEPYTNYLLERGAKKTDLYFHAIMIKAIQTRQQETLREVLSTHAFLANGLTADENPTPLERAIWATNAEGFSALLDNGATLNDKEATRLLGQAISRKNFDIAELVLKANPSTPVNQTFEVDGESSVESPMLRDAAADNNLEWVHRLIERGAVLDAKKLQSYPIYGPAMNLHLEAVSALLEAGSVANPVDPDTGESLIDVVKGFGEKYPDFADQTGTMIELLEAHQK